MFLSIRIARSMLILLACCTSGLLGLVQVFGRYTAVDGLAPFTLHRRG